MQIGIKNLLRGNMPHDKSSEQYRSIGLQSTSIVLCGWLVLGLVANAEAQLDFEKPPIDYGKVSAEDRVAQLAADMEDGTVRLEYSAEHGWLPALLKELDISPESQTLVFSKTSLQLHKISPRTPRALYFNDDVYVGWCQRGDVVEIAATDPRQGAVFYTIDQDRDLPPKIVRDRGQCLTCHATNRTQGVPGYLVRSVYSDFNGRPRSGTRTYVTDHSTEFEKRFGGWYVSGQHGRMRHMGNIVAEDRSDPESLDREQGANRMRLEELLDTDPYLTPQSDIVALMVLEHQSQMHNLIARASFETRIASYYDRGINAALERPLDTVSPSTERRIAAAGEELIRYMLFADELQLSDPVSGPSEFTEQFAQRARRDARGRSLRDLDLQTRLFKYPCSYLIYSDAFAALPEAMNRFIRTRLSEILFSEQTPDGYSQLSDADRQAVREILQETLPGYLSNDADAG